MTGFFDTDGFDPDEIEDERQYPKDRYGADPIRDAALAARQARLDEMRRNAEARRTRKIERIQDRMEELGAPLDGSIVIALFDDNELKLDIVDEPAYIVEPVNDGWQVFDTQGQRAIATCPTEELAAMLVESLTEGCW